MDYYVYSVAVLPLTAIFLLGPARVYGLLSGVSIFYYAQTTMGLGILPMLDPWIEADRVHARVILLTLMVYVFTTTTASLFRRRRPKNSLPVIEVVKPSSGTWGLIWISVGISALYFAAVGYIAFFESMRGLFSGTEVDATALRLDSYSGGTYYFPGYVNQFKNSLLPSLVVIAIHFLFKEKVPSRFILSAVLVTLSIIFLLGTGQRGAFVKFALIMILYVFIASRRHFKKFAFWIGLSGIGFFFLSTAASGRADNELTSVGSGFERFTVLFNQLIFRLTGSNQESAVAGFRYTYEMPVQHGKEWFQSIIGLLPGVSGSDLDNQIFASIYGSTRGTAPPSIWGSVYYNFGELGCIVFAVLFALLLIKVSTLGSNAKRLNTFQVIGIAGVNVIAGSWIAGSPVYLFNFGVMVYLFLWVYGNQRMKRAEAMKCLSDLRPLSIN